VIRINLLHPGYIQALFRTTPGKVLVVLAIVMVVSGSLVIKRIVNIQVLGVGMLLLLLGLALFGLAAVMLARLLVVERTPPARLQAQIEAYGFEAASPNVASRPLTGRVDALAATLGAMLAGRMKNFREDALRKELQAAGLYTMNARKFMGYRLLSTLALPLIWLWFASTSGAGPLRFIVGLVFAIAFGWQGPLVLVRRPSRKRLEAIDTHMPELINLLVTTTEAGVA